FDGKPPRGGGEMRPILKSIASARDSYPSGPYGNGLPKSELIAISSEPPSDQRPTVVRKRPTVRRKRDPVRDRRLLLDHSALTGSVMGGALGANLGFAVMVILGWHVSIPSATVIGLLSGSLSGIALARCRITQSRHDLFAPR
ncbi:MAG: hypothetical protein QF805_31340, partial [Pirellulaceae bacterium]|nr:hypothetical protein [Pirellulaceae bacterium]